MSLNMIRLASRAKPLSSSASVRVLSLSGSRAALLALNQQPSSSSFSSSSFLASRNFNRNNRNNSLSSSFKTGLLQSRPSSLANFVRLQQQQSLRSFASVTEHLGSLGDSVSEGTVVEWVKTPGQWVEADELYVIVESDKVSVDIRAKQAGLLKETLVQEGEDVAVGAPIAVFDTAASKPSSSSSSSSSSSPSPSSSSSSSSPAAAEPVKQQTASAPAPSSSSAKPVSSPASSSASSSSSSASSSASAGAVGQRGERRVQMTRMRQTISRRLKDAQNVNAMLTTFQEVDMSGLMNMRSSLKDEFLETHGVKLGFMSGFVKAATSALKKFPDVNAVIDGKDVVYRDYVDVSVAVSTPTGLVVPVLRNTEHMSFADVEKAIAALGQKARNNQIAIEDMLGGTFTISNGGVFGSLFGTPIINPPQSAILGMHAINKRAVVVNDEIVIRPVMVVALTYDHRLIDGAMAVQFLKHIKLCVEDPSRLLLDL